MSRAYLKDIRLSIQKGWKRFLSILAITALGVAMLTGLYASCLDMYHSADQFYDEQNLFDVRILSTLGLSQEDVDALASISGIEVAEGIYSEKMYTDIDGARSSVEMTVLSAKGINRPYLLSGRFPENPGEIAVTQKYLDKSGKAVGDRLTMKESSDAIEESDDTDLDIDMDIALEEKEGSSIVNSNYIITGAVMDAMDIQSDGYASTFRAASASDYTFFITPEDEDSDIFTSVYLVLSEEIGRAHV